MQVEVFGGKCTDICNFEMFQTWRRVSEEKEQMDR